MRTSRIQTGLLPSLLSLLIPIAAHAQSVADLKAGATETTITGGKKKPAEPPK